MTEDGDRVLNIRQAAQIIYNTREPTSVELGKVCYLLDRGVLKGTRQAHWTTTAQWVADFLADRSLHSKAAVDTPTKTRSAPDPRRHRQLGRPPPSRNEGLPDLYRQILTDYFLAVIKRRDLRHRSHSFQRAVLAGQVVLLVLLVAVCLFTWRMGRVIVPPEQRIVADWIAADVEQFQIIEWFPVETTPGGGARLRVQYRYLTPGTTNRKSVLTDRVFELKAGRVTGVSNADPD